MFELTVGLVFFLLLYIQVVSFGKVTLLSRRFRRLTSSKPVDFAIHMSVKMIPVIMLELTNWRIAMGLTVLLISMVAYYLRLDFLVWTPRWSFVPPLLLLVSGGLFLFMWLWWGSINRVWARISIYDWPSIRLVNFVVTILVYTAIMLCSLLAHHATSLLI